MARARRGLWLVAAALVVAVCCGVAAAMALAAARDEPAAQRDEALFLKHVKEFFGGANPEPKGVANTVYIAEGDHACQWLASKPVVTGRAPDQGAYRLFKAFLRQEEPIDGWTLGRSNFSVRGSVAYDAWSYLCPDVRETRVWVPPPEHDD